MWTPRKRDLIFAVLALTTAGLAYLSEFPFRDEYTSMRYRVPVTLFIFFAIALALRRWWTGGSPTFVRLGNIMLLLVFSVYGGEVLCVTMLKLLAP